MNDSCYRLSSDLEASMKSLLLLEPKVKHYFEKLMFDATKQSFGTITLKLTGNIGHKVM